MAIEQGTREDEDGRSSFSLPSFWEQEPSVDGLVVRLRGELTIRDAIELRDRAMTTLNSPTVLCLGEVGYLDVAIAQVIHAWRQALRRTGHELKVIGTPASVRQELALVGLDAVLGREGEGQ